jgi:hypothetical protein
MSRPTDYFEAARTQARDAFVKSHSYYFLVGKSRMERAMKPRRTDIFDQIDPSQDNTAAATHVGSEVGDDEGAETMILAVRKVQDTFPSMITVGRTHNNDLCIPDVNVSRFHAFFRVHSDRVELADAGSANGTFVGKDRLEPKGPAKIVIPGDRVTFALLEYDFLDAGACWDRVHAVVG